MTTHELKCWPEYFQPVKDGSKPFELRIYDRAYMVGDTLLLREYEPVTQSYTGETWRGVVTYLLSSGPWLTPGYVMMGIKPAPHGSVFSRSECVFKYCASPLDCQERCMLTKAAPEAQEPA